MERNDRFQNREELIMYDRLYETSNGVDAMDAAKERQIREEEARERALEQEFIARYERSDDE